MFEEDRPNIASHLIRSASITCKPIPIYACRAASVNDLVDIAEWVGQERWRAKANGKPLARYIEQTRERVYGELLSIDLMAREWAGG